MTGMTYAGTGVDYDPMDRFKRMAQEAARQTAGNIQRLGFRVLEESYGESAFLLEPTDGTPYLLAHVEEGLGTKNLVADAMHRLTAKSFYDQIAQDTVAMIVNDLLTLGALPVSLAMHLAAGSSDWFKDERRCKDLVWGWKNACDLAGCAWGGGETPTLKGIVSPATVLLSGSATGVIRPLERRLCPERIQHGDAIVLVNSSGIHANGLTMARQIADKLPSGYLTKVDGKRTYGGTLLDPTRIYVGFMEACWNHGVDIHYAVNITGHGWRKLMRAPQALAYVIEQLPEAQPIFAFIQQHGPVSDEEAYGNLNMGAGFALYVPQDHVKTVLHVLHSHGSFMDWGAVHAGHIEPSDEKKVVIKPKNLEYLGSTLAVR